MYILYICNHCIYREQQILYSRCLVPFYCNTLQHTAMNFNTIYSKCLLPPYCNTPRHTATHSTRGVLCLFRRLCVTCLPHLRATAGAIE